MTQANPLLNLDALVHQHQVEAVQLAYLITRQAARAGEIAQATLPLPSAEFRLRWLRGVRSNAIRMAGGQPDSEDPVWLADSSGKEKVVEREMRGLIWEALGGLAPDARAVVALRFVFGLKDESLGSAMGCSGSEAMRRFRCAKRELAEALARADDEARDVELQGLFEEDTIGHALATQSGLAIPPGRDYVGARESTARANEEIRPAFRLSRSALARLIGAGAALSLAGLIVAGIAWFGRPPEVKPTPTPTPQPIAERTDDDCNLGFGSGALTRVGRGAISRALWAPDGRSVWVRSSAGFFVYDASTLRFKACNLTYETLARISPDAAVIATAGGGANGVTLRDAATFESRGAILPSVLATRVVSIDYHFSANRIAVATTDNAIEIRDSATGALLRPVVTLVGRASDVRFSPDGNWVTAIAFGRGLEFIDARKDTPARSFRNPGGFVAEAVFSADSQRAFVGDLNGVLALDLNSGQIITTVRDGTGFGRPIWANADGSAVLIVTAAASRDEATLTLMDVKSGRALRKLTLSASRFGAQSIVASPDGTRAIVIANDGFSLWNLELGELVNAVAGYAQGASNSGRAIAFNADGRILATPRVGGGLALLDPASGRLIRLMTLDVRQPTDMVWSPDGIRLAVTDGAGTNRNSSGADAATGINVVDFSADAAVTQFFPGASQPRFSTEGGYLFYRPRDGTEVRYYSFQNRVNTGYYRPYKAGEPASFDGFAISPDYGKMLVAKGDAVEVWDIARSERLASWSGAIVRQFRRDPGNLQLSMSPDNESLLVVSPLDGIKVLNWSPPAVRFVAAGPVGEAASPQQVQTLRAAFSPNGKWLAALAPTSAGSGNALTLNDSRSGKIVLRIEAPTFAVAIAFSPDSKSLAYLTADDVVRFIDVASLR